MHRKLMRVTARTAVIGAVIVLGSAAAAPGAMAKPTTSAIVPVPCNTPALISAINNASGGQKLQLAFGCTYQLTAPLPTIDTNLTIVGFGASLERSEADGTSRFRILTVDGADVNLVEVNFYNGGAGFGDDDDDDDDGGAGGAILNVGGNISVLGGTFAGNSDSIGGAIFNESGTLAMTSVYFTYNSARVGGAIYNDGTMTLRSSHFPVNEGVYGGAIFNNGTATVIGTTFTQDQAERDGGAFFNEGQGSLSSVTVQHDEADFGGGIYNEDTLAVASSNIVSNDAEFGGGIYNEDDESVTLSRTKVSGNEPDNCEPINTIAGCSG
jgi:predicted outer membrane repeat protein